MVGTGCEEIADVVCPRQVKCQAPDGVPNEAFQSAALVMVTQLEDLLKEVHMGGRFAAAWCSPRLVELPKSKRWRRKRPNVDRWGLRRVPQNFVEDFEKDGTALHGFAHGWHPTEIGGDSVTRGEALLGASVRATGFSPPHARGCGGRVLQCGA